jgi:UDP-galactose transporter
LFLAPLLPSSLTFVACIHIQHDEAPRPNINLTIGFAATIAACCCSGLAGVYFEKILKKSEVSLWTRNVQLGLYSIVIGLVGYYAEISNKEQLEGGFFHGYTKLTFFSISVQVSLIVHICVALVYCFFIFFFFLLVRTLSILIFFIDVSHELSNTPTTHSLFYTNILRAYLHI